MQLLSEGMYIVHPLLSPLHTHVHRYRGLSIILRSLISIIFSTRVYDLGEPLWVQEYLLGSQCNISEHRLLAFRLVGGGLWCRIITDRTTLSSFLPLSRFVFSRTLSHILKEKKERELRLDLCLRGGSCRRQCSPAFENLSTRNHECPLAIALKCVQKTRRTTCTTIITVSRL